MKVILKHDFSDDFALGWYMDNPVDVKGTIFDASIELQERSKLHDCSERSIIKEMRDEKGWICLNDNELSINYRSKDFLPYDGEKEVGEIDLDYLDNDHDEIFERFLLENQVDQDVLKIIVNDSEEIIVNRTGDTLIPHIENPIVSMPPNPNFTIHQGWILKPSQPNTDLEGYWDRVQKDLVDRQNVITLDSNSEAKKTLYPQDYFDILDRFEFLDEDNKNRVIDQYNKFIRENI